MTAIVASQIVHPVAVRRVGPSLPIAATATFAANTPNATASSTR